MKDARPALINGARRLSGVVVCLWMAAAAESAIALHADVPITAVVAGLQHSSASLRAAFVAAAVTELTAAYAVAVTRAERQGLASGVGWLAGTRSYMDDLETIGSAVNGGAAVQFLFGPDGPLRVVVTGNPRRQFMLTAPYPHERKDLERAVMLRFCQRVGCAAPLPYRASAGAQLDAAAQPVATQARDDGLGCKHGAVRHSKLYGRACAQLKGELRALVAALRASAQPVDWSFVRTPRREGTDHALSINADGGSVVLPMPGLFQAPQALADAIPWIRGQLAGKVSRFQLEPPARLVYGTYVAAR